MLTESEITNLLNKKRTKSLVSLIKIYRASNFDDQSIKQQVMSIYGRSFNNNELTYLIEKIK